MSGQRMAELRLSYDVKKVRKDLKVDIFHSITDD
jgi:hypothetical protein